MAQVWQLGSNTANFTLEGHEKGVNCLDYYSGGDKPYLISGADDRYVKIWDYQVSSYSRKHLLKCGDRAVVDSIILKSRMLTSFDAVSE